MKLKNKIQCYSSFMLGHTIPMAKVADILQERYPDWDITLVTYQVTKMKIEKDYPKIKFVGLYPQFTSTKLKQFFILPLIQRVPTLFGMFQDYIVDRQDLPDLIIADFFTNAVINFAKKRGIKLVVNFPTSYCAIQKIYNFLSLQRSYNIEGYLINYSLPKVQQLDRYDRILDSFRNWGRVIFHSFTGLDDACIMPSNHSYVGILPNRNTQQISQQLKIWMQSWKSKGKNKFLYVSFGTLLTLSSKFTKQLAHLLIDIGYPTIWSLNSSNKSQISHELIYHREWQPQIAVLNLPQVRGYMTHCGWGSICQAINSQTPLICVPAFSDQPPNAKMVVRKNIGVQIFDQILENPFGAFEFNINQEQIKKKIVSLMEDEIYIKSMERMFKMSRIRKTQDLICKVVQQTLEFGFEHLICPEYENSTIKIGVPLQSIIKDQYFPGKKWLNS